MCRQHEKRKLERANELEMIRTDAMIVAKEIEDMTNEILVGEFEHLIRNGDE